MLLPIKSGGASLLTAPDKSWVQPINSQLADLGRSQTSNPYSYGCTSMTFRYRGDLAKTMHQGCFQAAAFGWYDPAQSVAIFNGTDEAEAIRYGNGGAALSVLPGSLTVGRFGGNPPLGSYMYLYTYLPRNLNNNVDYLSLLPYKSLDGTPNSVLKDNNGQPLAINSTAMNYSARGQWLVAESPDRALVRINLASYQVFAFAPSFASLGSPYALYPASIAITEDGRYVAAANIALQEFMVYDLAACSTPTTTPVTTNDLTPYACPSHNYWSYLAKELGTAPTAFARLRFLNDGLLAFDATVNGQINTYELSPDGSTTSLINYLGLGDSYTSGEGANNYLLGTATDTNRCHISGHSYPLLLGSDAFSDDGHSVACSGAKIKDIVNDSISYKGQVSDGLTIDQRQTSNQIDQLLGGFLPGYLPQISFVKQYQPGVITVGIGGNDIGFSSILMRCISPLTAGPHLNLADCYRSYEDRLEVEQTIDQVYPRWVTLFSSLKAQAPAARIYAIGYPQIVAAGGRCGLNVHLSSGEIDFARQTIDYLNHVVATAAAAAGVNFVDITDALEGYQLCQAGQGQSAVNGLTAGHDTLGIFSAGSYHPTAFGQQLIEQAILQATNHFASSNNPGSSPSVSPPQPQSGDALLQAPKSGRQVVNVIPSDSLTGRQANRDTQLNITVNGPDTGLAPGTVYTVKLDSTPIGTITSDSDSSLNGQVTVPPNSDSGIQIISVSGPNQSGDTTSVTQPVYINDSPTDADGDGQPDSTDSCPLVVNSGIDQDADGIDDVCDGFISTPSTVSPADGLNVAPPDPQTPSPDTTNPQQAAASTIVGSTTTDIFINTFGPQATTVPISGLGPAKLLQTAATKQGPAGVYPANSTIIQDYANTAAYVPHTRLPRFAWWFWLGLFVLLLLIRTATNRFLIK